MAKAVQTDRAYTDFKAAFCSYYGFTGEEFVTELLWRSLDPLWRPVVFGVRQVWPAVLASDVRYLERVGGATSWREVVLLANNIPSTDYLNCNLLRRWMHLRISGGHLMKVRQEIGKFWET